MALSFFRKYVSLLMVMVTLTVSLSTFCRSACASELSIGASSPGGTVIVASLASLPDVPIDHDHHGEGDHCDSCCHCPCHAPLTVPSLHLVPVPVATSLVFHEPFQSIPEVYLPKYIPPHILA
ncbi:hypothetical protein [Geomonas sp. Red32]|uniref:hypothetical protein n=1 Tax=Geomonas sp. Red32 TaxID=2912856 RepID=UPI00202CD37E|nr:hypothetical protein [Geomonas sp. Red32]